MNAAACRARVAALLLAPAAVASAQTSLDTLAPSWHAYGSNTLRFEHFDNGGDPDAPFFPFEGWHAYDELNLGFAHRASPWDSMRGYLLGLGNASDYRSTERGLLLERGSLTWEKGDVALPFRATAGDYFGFLSQRTLQRPLKGLQVELQPAAPGRTRQSVMLMLGTDKPAYRDFDPRDDLYSAASWLLRAGDGARIGVNFVHNLRERSATLARRDQSVLSVAAAKPFGVLGHRLNVEGELSWLTGDVEEAGRLRTDASEAGWFAQLRGDDRRGGGALFYRLRAEHYGRDYSPSGAAVIADRRSLEGHAGWRFTSGLTLRGRLQRFRDDYESQNPLDTDTAGVSLAGPVAVGMQSALDAFVQRRRNRERSVDAITRSVSLNLSAALAPAWTARVGALLQSDDDRSATGADRVVREVRLALDHRFSIARTRGVVSPGVVARAIRGGDAASDEFGPTLALDLTRGAHALRLDYALLRQDRERADDVLDHRLGFRYTWTRTVHQLGFELDWLGRDPDADPGAHGDRVAAFYQFSFDRPAVVAASAPVAALAAQPGGDGGALDVARLAPGLTLDEALARVRAAGLGEPLLSRGGALLEVRLLDEVVQRQRLVLDVDGERLARASLIIAFDDVGDGVGAARTYEQVRGLLVQRYGSPERSVERGELGASLAAGVNAGRVIRVDEWRTPGGWLRFGIPRRLDGQVRMELQHARRFPNPQSTLWSVDAVY